VIECLSYGDFIARYDTAETLFYLDPPYRGSETDYGKGVFSRSDFQVLADQLRQLRAGAIVSLNDTPEVRQAFDGFDLEEVELTYTVNGSAPQAARELIIRTPGLPCRKPEPSLFG
jgi:DNA adenine methylase